MDLARSLVRSAISDSPADPDATVSDTKDISADRRPSTEGRDLRLEVPSEAVSDSAIKDDWLRVPAPRQEDTSVLSKEITELAGQSLVADGETYTKMMQDTRDESIRQRRVSTYLSVVAMVLILGGGVWTFFNASEASVVTAVAGAVVAGYSGLISKRTTAAEKATAEQLEHLRGRAVHATNLQQALAIAGSVSDPNQRDALLANIALSLVAKGTEVRSRDESALD